MSSFQILNRFLRLNQSVAVISRHFGIKQNQVENVLRREMVKLEHKLDEYHKQLTETESKTIICPGCGHDAAVTGEHPISHCPYTGAETEAHTQIDCERCGERWWPDADIAAAYESSEAWLDLEVGA